MLEVSVVIPAYNAMHYLPQTVASVLRQTYQNFEVIIVNDGSTDGIEAWFAQSVNDPRFRLISQKNQGLSSARNTGIEQAKGEFIAVLDADDLWHPTKLAKQVQALKRAPEAGLVYTWLKYVDEFARPTGKTVKASFEGDVWEQLTAFNFVGCGSVAMIRRACFDEVGRFDRNLISYVEDWDMWLRIAKRYPFTVVNEALVYNRKYTGSLSTQWRKMEDSFPKVIEKAFASAPPELIHLKHRSYAYAHLCLAWKVIQSQQKDLRVALSFWRKAFLGYPPIVFVASFINMGVILWLLACFGLEKYNAIQSFILSLRRRV
ncbi:MAG: glycosyltransferase family A protein, partial [Pseudomonadota bacterium]